MNHLKTYKAFESLSEDLISNVRDICLEIEDDGRFKCSVNTKDIKGISKHYVLIYLSDIRDYDGFTFGEVKDVILRLKDYLGDKYDGCSALISGEIDRVEFDIDNEESIDYLDKAYNRIDAPGIGNLVIWIK